MIKESGSGFPATTLCIEDEEENEYEDRQRLFSSCSPSSSFSLSNAKYSAGGLI